MNRYEKAFMVFYWLYMLAYVLCFFLLFPRYPDYTTLFQVFGMVPGVAMLIIVFRDLYKRHFPNPNSKITWTILILAFWPSILVYLCKYGFHPRESSATDIG